MHVHSNIKELCIQLQYAFINEQDSQVRPPVLFFGRSKGGGVSVLHGIGEGHQRKQVLGGDCRGNLPVASAAEHLGRRSMATT